MSGGQHFQHSGDGHNILNGYRPRDTGYSNEDAAVLYEDPCARFFQIKSASIGNILISFEQNVWATSTINESIFTQAFESAPFVIFLFSVNKSGCFCGYSLMKSKPGLAKGPSGVFKTNENVTYRGQSFDVEWIRIITLNFIECNELKNPLNFNKSVRIAKDGQEIDRDVGKKLCQLIEMEWKTYLNSTKRFLPPTKTLSSSQYPYKKQPPVHSREISSSVVIDAAAAAAALQCFPIDITKMNYEKYVQVYEKSKNKESSKVADFSIFSGN